MFLIGLVALAACFRCLNMICKCREHGVHTVARRVFSKNDVIENAAVVVRVGGVFVTGTQWPDSTVGPGIAYLVFRVALAIIEYEPILETRRKLCER